VATANGVPPLPMLPIGAPWKLQGGSLGQINSNAKHKSCKIQANSKIKQRANLKSKSLLVKI
jgi:hypothetical protein